MTIEELKKRVEKLGLRVDRESGKILVEWEKIPFEESDRPYWAALSSIDGIGPATFPILVAGFGSAEAVFRATSIELRAVGLSEKIAERVVEIGKNNIPMWFQNSMRMIATSLGTTSDSLHFLVPKDADFPPSLLKLEHGPSQLWAWGDTSLLLDDRIVAVVGTRKISPYGKAITSELSEQLGTRGCTVVSGLMYGVDECAMQGAISGGGKTIGVWAGGLTRSSLGSRFALALDVVKHGGVVISEFSPDHTPQKGMFPARNRIVSGLSRGVVVTEGAIKSGSLITANAAMEQGKPVGAVPGPVTSVVSGGPNELLKLGATVVTTAAEVMAMCGISTRSAQSKKFDFKAKNGVESAIFQALSSQPLTADELARTTSFSISDIGENLTNLDLLGVVKQIGEEWKLV